MITPIIAAVGEFDYDGFSKACHAIYNGLLPFAFLMAVVGIVLEWSGGYGDMERRMQSLVNHVVVIAILFMWYPENGQISLVQNLWNVGNSIADDLNAPDEATLDGLLGGLVVLEVAATVAKDKASTQGDKGHDWTEYVQQFSGLGAILFQQYAKIIQAMSMMMMGALGPIFFGLMLYEGTKNTGIWFVSSTIGIAMWPIGWALCRFGTKYFLEVGGLAMGGQAITGLLAGDPFAAMSAVSWAAIVGGWMVMTTIGVPGILQGLMTFGASTAAGQFMGSERGGFGGAVGSGGMPSGGAAAHGGGGTAHAAHLQAAHSGAGAAQQAVQHH